MSDGYLGTTERAAIIRKELKAKHAWTGKDVSVRADHYSMGSAIRISIKKPDIPLQAVKEIASAHENIHRDDATGEILCGGNRFVEVGYSSEAREAIAARHLPAVEEAAAKLEAEPGYLIPVGDSGFMLGAGRHGLGYGFSVWRSGLTGSHEAEVGSLKEAATLIGMGGSRR